MRLLKCQISRKLPLIRINYIIFLQKGTQIQDNNKFLLHKNFLDGARKGRILTIMTHVMAINGARSIRSEVSSSLGSYFPIYFFRNFPFSSRQYA